MTSFDSGKMDLAKLLEEVREGKVQLPNFQRGRVWDDAHIRSLLVSIARSFPIGAIMLLETGGEVNFEARPVADVTPTKDQKAERLILDGQQRLTALTQVLKLESPVATRDERKREIKRYYYFDISKALAGPSEIEESVIAVPENRVLTANFGREIALDLSSPEKEYKEFHFPCNKILDSSEWWRGLVKAFPGQMDGFATFQEQVIDRFKKYQVPVIKLDRETTREAVCLVFEKVNTGGVQLRGHTAKDRVLGNRSRG